jgi:hypothetical protein
MGLLRAVGDGLQPPKNLVVVDAALRLFIGTANRSRPGRLERDPLEIDLSISTEAIYADFFSGLYDLTIASYLL